MFYGGVIFQMFDSGTSATTVYTAAIRTEITRIMVVNSAAVARTFDIYHSEAGSSSSTSNALYYQQSVPGNGTYEILSTCPGGGITISKGGALVFKASNANELTVTGYGNVQVVG